MSPNQLNNWHFCTNSFVRLYRFDLFCFSRFYSTKKHLWNVRCLRVDYLMYVGDAIPILRLQNVGRLYFNTRNNRFSCWEEKKLRNCIVKFSDPMDKQWSRDLTKKTQQQQFNEQKYMMSNRLSPAKWNANAFRTLFQC